MMIKKAQLSVETMIIWGLVILVALSVVGVLLYFNVLDLGTYLPDTCDIGGAGDLKCEEMKLSGTDTVLELGIRNIGQKTVNIIGVTVTDEDQTHFQDPKENIGSDTNPIATIGPGEIELVSINVESASSGNLLRGTLVTTYKFTGGVVEQEASGTIRIRAS